MDCCVAVVDGVVVDGSVDVDSRDVNVELDDSRSEFAQVYLMVLISSSSGVRNETCFCVGNMGREAILRGTIRLLDRIELRLCGCLYGIVLLADSLEADVSAEDDEESVEAESGVQMLVETGVELLMSRRSFAGGPGGGATKVLRVLEVFVVVFGSYALLKVLRTVGDAALRVSSRREAPFPKTRGWWVLTDSLGRCEGRVGIIGSEVAMVDCSAGDDEKVGGAGWDDIVESIMGETCRTREPGGRRQRQCGGDPQPADRIRARREESQGAQRESRLASSSRDSRRFVYYCVYGWSGWSILVHDCARGL